ncbi:hypothetical protein JTB14_004667 [Gonioctena quinquepunctata]|nr:hypothetical protein JTB14_004667 [Gonioctena quinquepunctata]
MGKYSSDSDNEKRGSKNSSKSSRSRRRSSSSDSVDSRSKRRRDKKSSRRSRSRSRDRFGRTRRSRSRSSSNYRSSKTKSHRSDSRDRYRDRHRRSKSKDRYRSRRSGSKSYIKEFVSKPKKRSSSSSSSDSFEQSSTSKSKSSRVKKEVVSVKERIPKNGKGSPDCVIVDNTVLNEINEDTFTPKQFSSTKSKKVPDNIVIDLRKNTIKVPEVEQLEPDSIFHHSLFLNEEARMEKWVKDLYSFRQKALQPSVKN